VTGLDRKVWLRLEAICFSRGPRRVLDDVSLSFRPAELTLLVGANGSGKTTLLKIISGLLKPDQATLEYQSRQIGWRRLRNTLLTETCYLHQNPYLFDANVFDNISYGLKVMGAPGQLLRERTDLALETTSLQHLAQRHSSELSSGERQRVAIARAWALSPRLMLMDEPLANMDQAARHQCRLLIRQLQESGMGIILTSHEGRHKGLDITREIKLADGRLTQQSPLPSGSTVVPLRPV
jgi:energy-coupling factor transporter ATP-binding protein EcfA2